MASNDKLLEGFQRFKKQYFGSDNKLYNSMKNGQPAKTLMVACCDSRVDPAILMDCDPGDLFTVRNIANLVPPCEIDDSHHGTSAALEFAVNNLEVENIIVMGHANCGGIQALWQDDGSKQTQFINTWASIAKQAKEKVKKELSHSGGSTSERDKLKMCEQQAILVSLDNLLTFSCIKERVDSGLLSLHGWYFDMPAGELLIYNPQIAKFVKAPS